MEIQTHYLSAAAESMKNAVEHGQQWMVYDGRGYMTNPTYLQYFGAPETARKEAGIDNSIPTHQRAVLLPPVAEAVSKMAELHQSGQMKFGHVVTVDIDKIINDYKLERPRATVELTKANPIHENNLAALNKQVIALGFNASLITPLKEAFEKGEKEFMLPQVDEAGKKTTAATLQFRETVNGDRVVLDRFNAFIQKTPTTEAITKTFFVSEHGNNINYPEAIKLLEGKAIAKEEVNSEGVVTKPWLQLDFKNIDERGQYELKKINNYNIDAVLAARPIKELVDDTERAKIISQLEKGEKVAVTYENKSISMKGFIEAAPRFNTLHYYDRNQKRISLEQIKQTLTPAHQKNIQQENKMQLQEGKKRKLSV